MYSHNVQWKEKGKKSCCRKCNISNRGQGGGGGGESQLATNMGESEPGLKRGKAVAAFYN